MRDFRIFYMIFAFLLPYYLNFTAAATANKKCLLFIKFIDKVWIRNKSCSSFFQLKALNRYLASLESYKI